MNSELKRKVYVFRLDYPQRGLNRGLRVLAEERSHRSETVRQIAIGQWREFSGGKDSRKWQSRKITIDRQCIVIGL